MKNRTRALLGMGLLVSVALLTISQRQSSSARAAVAGPVHLPADLRVMRASASEAADAASPAREASEPTPPLESPWAKELRRLKDSAAQDPDAALGQVADMPDKHERLAAARAVCVVVAAKDPAKAMTAAWGLDLGKLAHEREENATLEQLAQQWAEKDLVNALLWESALPADEEGRRDRVTKGIAVAVSRVEPAEAARVLAERISAESNVQMEAVLAVVHEWAGRDAAAAARWVALFPPGAVRDRAIDEVASATPR